MSMTRKIIALTGVLLVAGAASAAEAAKHASRGQQEANDAAAIVRMMDADKNGVVSKDEFLNYMSQVFDRLDTNKNMQLESSELRRLPAVITGQFSSVCERANPPPRCITPEPPQLPLGARR